MFGLWSQGTPARGGCHRRPSRISGYAAQLAQRRLVQPGARRYRSRKVIYYKTLGRFAKAPIAYICFGELWALMLVLRHGMAAALAR